MNYGEPEIEEEPDDDRLYCDQCGVEVDPKTALIPPLCNECSARLN